MKNIVLFASGSGSNVENIVTYFQNLKRNVSFYIFTNNPNAFVIERAKKLNVSCEVFTRQQMNDGSLLQRIQEIHPDLIVLAGFLWKFPQQIIEKYPKVINIHPALLPKFGGKGMYGMHVHEAVVANKEVESGITIHYVNEHYDEGTTIFQAKVSIAPTDTAEDVATKIHQLEYEHFPKIIETLI